MSQSGEEAPLHSLRGPRIGEIKAKSDRETVLGSSRLHGRDKGEGDEEDEDVNDGDKEEEKGHCSGNGLLPPEFILHVDCVSESSSDMMLLLQFSSSNISDVTRLRQDEKQGILLPALLLAQTKTLVHIVLLIKLSKHWPGSIRNKTRFK